MELGSLILFCHLSYLVVKKLLKIILHCHLYPICYGILIIHSLIVIPCKELRHSFHIIELVVDPSYNGSMNIIEIGTSSFLTIVCVI